MFPASLKKGCLLIWYQPLARQFGWQFVDIQPSSTKNTLESRQSTLVWFQEMTQQPTARSFRNPNEISYRNL